MPKRTFAQDIELDKINKKLDEPKPNSKNKNGKKPKNQKPKKK